MSPMDTRGPSRLGAKSTFFPEKTPKRIEKYDEESSEEENDRFGAKNTSGVPGSAREQTGVMRRLTYVLVAVASLRTKDQSLFTYSAEAKLQIGTVVRVPFGRETVLGVVVEQVKQKPKFKTKSAEVVELSRPLPTTWLNFVSSLAETYDYPLSALLAGAIPHGLYKSRRSRTGKATALERHSSRNFKLTKDQQAVIDRIDLIKSDSVLLHGDTGTGKTLVYRELANKVTSIGKSVLILVPEIALTPQLASEFAQDEHRVFVLHSHLTDAERHIMWLEILSATGPIIVLGARSALFAPVDNYGLIIVDEAHEPSYKQEQTPRYHAVRAASLLAKAHSATLVMGTATPLVSDYYLAEATKHPILRMTEIANPEAVPPVIEVIDMRDHDQHHKTFWMSKKLHQATTDALTSGKQVMLFLNRRGTARVVLCTTCGWHAACDDCNVSYVYHHDSGQLVCHTCSKTVPLMHQCPECRKPSLELKSVGTKQLALDIQKLFPQARVARFDADGHKGETVRERYEELYKGDIDIMIGTQVLAKGLDLPKLALVGVVLADSSMFFPDFTASERTFQLLHQIAGRVGRHGHGRVILQTYDPEHIAVEAAKAKSYEQFYEHEIAVRKAFQYPPFVYLTLLTVERKTQKGAEKAALTVAQTLRNIHLPIRVLGPSPAFHEKRHGIYRWQIVLKSKSRKKLIEAARHVPQDWVVDLDPVNLL